MNNGFTLIEVLVAMAIAASVLVTVGGITAGYISNTDRMIRKLAADITLQNLADRFYAPYKRNQKYRPNSIEDGVRQQGPYTFRYSQTIQATATEGLREVTLTIYDGDDPLRSLTFFADVL